MAEALSSEVLLVGQKLRLLALSTTKSRLSTVLVGARAGRYLIVEMPKIGGVQIKLDDETTWAISFITQGQVYNFNTSVIGSTLRPFPLTFLRFPQEAEISHLRCGRRYPVNLPALIKELRLPPKEDDENAPPPESQATMIKGLVVDISSGGCLLGATIDLPVDSQLDLELYRPDGQRLTDLKAEVKSTHEKMGTHYLGLSFLGFSAPESQQAFAAFMDDLEQSPLRL